MIMHGNLFAALLLLSVPVLSNCTDDAACPTGATHVNGVCNDDDPATAVDASNSDVGSTGSTDGSNGESLTDAAGPDDLDAAANTFDAAQPDATMNDAGADGAIAAKCFIDNDRDGVGAGDAVDCTTHTATDASVDGSVALTLVSASGDCDDNDAARAPNLDEMCDGVDNNCDAVIDEKAKNACGGICTRSLDHQPGDKCTNGLLGACAREGTYICQGDSAVTCNAPTVQPSGELCGDSKDNDCDGYADEPDAVDALLWYQDCDGDGYASTNSGAIKACTKPAPLSATCTGWVTLAPVTGSTLDCDDTSAKKRPNAAYEYAASSSVGDADADCDKTVELEATPMLHAQGATTGLVSVPNCSASDINLMKGGVCPTVLCAVWGATSFSGEGFEGTPLGAPPSNCVDNYKAIVKGPKPSGSAYCATGTKVYGGVRCR